MAMMAAVSSTALHQSEPVPAVPDATGGRQQVPAEEHPTEGERGTVNSVWSKHKVYSLLQSAAARNAFVNTAVTTSIIKYAHSLNLYGVHNKIINKQTIGNECLRYSEIEM